MTSRRFSKERGWYGFRSLLSQYRYIAKKAGRVFVLTDNQFRELTSARCYYCGTPPAQLSKPDRPRNPTRSEIINGTYTYNGVDRLDSSKGYFLGNVVPACGRCNTAKMDTPYPEFLKWLKLIFINLKAKGEI